MDTTMLKPGSAQALMQLVRRMLLEVNTAIPGEIIAFNPVLQTVTAKPCIKGTTITNEGQTVFVPLPQIIEVPVYFPFSTTTGFSLTYPVVPGDQCLLLFSQRSFDNWLTMGSVQDPSEPGEPRSHQYPDALALIGFSPNPLAIKDFQQAGSGSCLSNGIEIRSMTRNSYVKVMDEEVRIHEGKADIDIHTDGTMEFSIHKDSVPNDGLPTMTGVTYLKIAPDGTTTLLTPNTLNVTSTNVNVISSVINVTAASSVAVTCPISTFIGNVKIDGNLVVTSNTQSNTYSVGSGDNTKPGATGSSDAPSYQAGLVIG